MKKAIGSFHELKRTAYKHLKQAGKTGLLSLLILALALGPLSSVTAGAEALETQPESVFSVIYEAVRAHARGEFPTGGAMPGDKLADALAILDDFNLNVLKDPRLAAALDEIIGDIFEDERMVEGIQEKKEFVAEILRDPRLSAVLGDIITAYLQDERLVADIEQLFGMVFDLITDDELHYFIRDALAALIEEPRLAASVNDLMLETVSVVYGEGANTVANLVSDERVPLFFKKLVGVLVSPLPDLLAITYDQRVRSVTEDLLLVLLDHEMELAVGLVENEDLKGTIADLLLLMVEPVPAAVADLGLGLVDHAASKVAVGVTDGTVDTLLNDLVDHLFIHPGGSAQGLQPYFYNAFGTVKDRSTSRASGYCPTDTDVGWGLGNQNIQKQVAEGLAEIPPDLVQQAFFNWLVFDNPENPYDPGELDYVPRTYYAWAADIAGLLSTERAEGLVEAFYGSLEEMVGSFVNEHEKDILNSLRQAVEGLPMEDIAAQIREDSRMESIPEDLVDAITGAMPLEELAEFISEEAAVIEVLDGIYEDFVDDLPFDEAGRRIREDQRILNTLQESIPGFSLSEIAESIRTDSRVLSALARVAAETPVDVIIDFIQKRASLIGHTAARVLLNLVADFVGDEALADFLHGVLHDAVFDSLGGSPGLLITDSLAAFLNNEEFATYLVESLYRLTYGVDYELWQLYRQVVPRFFTHVLWELL